MKARHYVSILALSAAAFAACNNGDYDAQPSVDGSGIQNPINPSLPAAKGTMKVRIDGGQFLTLDSCRFSREDTVLTVGAIKLVPGENTRQVILYMPAFKAIGEFPITTDTTKNSGSYATYFGVDLSSLTGWSTASFLSPLTGNIKVELASATEVKGSFQFSASKIFPNYDAASKVTLTEGTFWATPEQ